MTGDDPGEGPAAADRARRPSGPGDVPAPGPVPLSLLATVLAVASGFAGRCRDTLWTGILMVSVGVAFGVAAGLALRVFWRGSLREELSGAGGRYLVFLGGVLFTTAEAYAFGVALDRGAPAAAAAFLVPPVAVAAAALRSAASRVRFASGGRPDPDE